MDPASQRLLALLGNLTNYEKRRPDRPRWSLDNMRSLLARPGCAALSGLAVQVGGSKGKGTTSLYLERLATAAGLRSGTYMSPHVQSVLERVRIDEKQVAEADLHRALAPILDHARTLENASFFEVMTAAALACFAEAAVDLAILEVGLGGRLDATTAVPVDASIVTSIELEHTDMLGDTIEAIAGEKAHVIRPGRPAFTSATGEALAVLEARARDVGASLSVLGRDIELVDVRDTGSGFEGRLRLEKGELEFSMPEASQFELSAFALSTACLRRLRPDLPLTMDPAPRPVLPGRCEVVRCGDGRPLVLDGAHTEESMRALASELRRRFPGQKLAILFGSTPGKRWRESLKCLLAMADTTVVTQLEDTAMVPPEEILEWLDHAGAPGMRAHSIEEGLAMLARSQGVRVVTGSFYLVGEARSHLGALGASAPV